jgi:flagellar hook-basal body complex protein FliE
VTVRLLVPDAPVPEARPRRDAGNGASAFARAVDALGSIFQDAKAAENSYASGKGTLRDAIYERVRADVALSVTVAAAQRAAQAMQTVLSMQI